MNWKQIIYTSVITLLVTIVSGVIVNWYTANQIEEKPPQEKILFDFKNISKFQTDSIKISLYTLEVWNEGTRPANGVNVKVIFKGGTKVIDANGTFSRTNQNLSPITNGHNIEFHKQKLYGKDKMIISIAIDGIASEPNIVVDCCFDYWGSADFDCFDSDYS